MKLKIKGGFAYSWYQRAAAVVLSAVLVAGTVGVGDAFVADAKDSGVASHTIAITQEELLSLLETAGEDGNTLDSDALPFGTANDIAAENIEDVIDDSGMILLDQRAVGEYGSALILAKVNDGENPIEKVGFIAMSGDPDIESTFSLKITGENIYIYSAVVNSWQVQIAEPTDEPLPEEIPEQQPVEESDVSSSEPADTDTSSSEPANPGTSSSEAASSDASSSETEKAESSVAEKPASSEAPAESEAAETEPENNAADGSDNGAAPASDETFSGAAAYVNSTRVAAAVSDEDGNGVIKEGGEESLGSSELAVLNGRAAGSARARSAAVSLNYLLTVPVPGYAFLEADVRPDNSPFDAMDRALNPTGAALPLASAAMTVSGTQPLLTGAAFNYKLNYKVEAAPSFMYSETDVRHLFEYYDGAEFVFSLPEGVELINPDDAGIKFNEKDGMYHLHIGRIDARGTATKSLEVGARISGNGMTPNNTTFAVSEAYFTANATVNDANTGVTRVYTAHEGMKFNADPLPVVVSSAADRWVVQKKITPQGGMSYSVSGDTLTVKYKVDIGLNNSGGSAPSNNDGEYSRYGRLRFKDFELVENLPVFDRAGGRVTPKSSKITFAETSTVVASGGEGVSKLTVTDYAKKAFPKHELDDTTPYYTAYDVTVDYDLNKLKIDFDDAEVSGGLTLDNNVVLRYILEGTSEWKENEANAAFNYATVGKPAAIKIEKKIREGKTTSKDYSYGTLLAKTYTGEAAFRIVDKDGKPAKAYALVDGKYLPMTEISVNPSQDDDETSAITGDTGFVMVYLPDGEYTITETEAPFATARSTEEKKVTVKTGETATVTFANQSTNGGLRFNKYSIGLDNSGNPNKKAPLSGATFEIRDGDRLVATATSDEFGEVMFRTVPAGTYTVTETVTPGGYLPASPQPVTIKQGEFATIGVDIKDGAGTVYNQSNETRLHVEKQVDIGDGKLISVPVNDIAEFEFTIERQTDTGWEDAGAAVQKLTSQNGKTFFDVKLPIYKAVDSAPSDANRWVYRVVEKAPAIYSMKSTTDETFTLTANQVKDVKIVNAAKGRVALQKLDWADGENGAVSVPAADRQFTLYKKVGDSFTAVTGMTAKAGEDGTALPFKTDADGKLTFENVDIFASGAKVEYYATEDEIPEGYALDGAIDIDGKKGVKLGFAALDPDPVKVNNFDARGSVTVTKLNGNAPLNATEYVAGAEFKLERVAADGTLTTIGEPITSVATAKGVTIKDLTAGTYRVTETKAPEGYRLFDDGKGNSYKEVTIPAVNTLADMSEAASKPDSSQLYNRVLFTNFKYAQVNLHKTVYDYGKGTLLASGGYESVGVIVYKMENGTLKTMGEAGVIESAGGMLTLTGLEPGEYYVAENAITQSGTAAARWLMPVFSGTSHIDGTAVERNNKNKLAYSVIGGTGYFGPYVVADPYATADREASKDFELWGFQNSSELKIKKTDKGGSPLAGAVFTATYKLGGSEDIVTVDSTPTGADGIATFKALPIYDSTAFNQKTMFTVTEKTAPTGYALNPTPITGITIDPRESLENGTGRVLMSSAAMTEKTTVIDNPQVSMSVYKTEIDSVSVGLDKPARKPLVGAELVLYKLDSKSNTLIPVVGVDGKTAVTKKTELGGVARFTGLDYDGAYYAIETAVPKVAATGRDYTLPNGKLLLAKGEDGTYPSIAPDDIGRYNYVTHTFEKPAKPVDAAIVDQPMTNVRPTVKFDIQKVNAPLETVGPNVEGAVFQLYGVPGDVKTAEGLPKLRADDDRMLGKLYTGHIITDKEGKVRSGVLDYGPIYYLREMVTPSGLPGEKHLVAMLPKETYDLVATDPAFATWQRDNNISAVFSYSISEGNVATQVTYTNSEPGSGDAPDMMRFAPLTIYKTLKDGDKEPTPLPGVSFDVHLLDKIGGKSIAVIERIVTDNEAGVAKASFDLDELYRKYADQTPNPIVPQYEKNADGTSTGKIKSYSMAVRLVEVSAPEGVQIPNTAWDGMIHSDPAMRGEAGVAKASIDSGVFDITNYPGNGVTVNLYGYQRRTGLKHADDLIAAKQSADEWLQANLNPAIDKILPIEGVPLNLKKLDAKGNWVTVSNQGRGYNTDARGQIVFNNLEYGSYRLEEGQNSAVAKIYEQKHTVYAGREYYFEYTNGLVINLYNPARPAIQIIKNDRQAFSPTGNPKQAGAKFKEGNTEGANQWFEIGADGASNLRTESIDQGIGKIIKEYAAPASGYTSKYVYFTTEWPNNRTADSGIGSTANREVLMIKTDWDGEEWPEDNLFRMYAYDAALASLEITKEDSVNSASKLAGAEFTVDRMDFNAGCFDKNGLLKTNLPTPPSNGAGWTDAKKVTTDANGEARLENLVPGWYRITETKAPAGYGIAKPVVVEVRGDLGGLVTHQGTFGAFDAKAMTTSVTIQDEAYSDYTINKTFDRGSLTDASIAIPKTVTFEVYTKKGSGAPVVLQKADRSPTRVNVSIVNGTGTEKISLPPLDMGDPRYTSDDTTYVFKEIDPGKWQITSPVPDDGGYLALTGDKTLSVTNRYAGAQIAVQKTDAKTSNPLKGAEFKVYYLDGKNAAGTDKKTYLTDADGKDTFMSNADGIATMNVVVPTAALDAAMDFFIEESKAPATYIASNEPVKVSIKAGDSVSYEKLDELTIENTQGLDVTITKRNNIYGQDTQNVSGIPFSLYLVSGDSATWVKDSTTGTDGTLTFPQLPLPTAGEKYAVWENEAALPVLYKNWTLESVHKANDGQPEADALQSGDFAATKNGADDGTKKLYLLEGAGVDKNYAYAAIAYNTPTSSLVIEKRAVGGEGSTVIAATFDIYKSDANGAKGDVVKQGIATSRVGDIGNAAYETEQLRALTPGWYLIEEVSADGGKDFGLNKYDTKYKLTQTVEIMAGESKRVVFENLDAKMSAQAEKKVIGEKPATSLLEGNVTAQFVITDMKQRLDRPLDSFKLTDSGITLTGISGASVAEKEQYTIKTVKVGSASYNNRIPGYEAAGETVRDIDVKVTFTAFDGATVVQTGKAGDSFTAPTDKRYKSFTVEYSDAKLMAYTASEGGLNLTPGFALGQDFTFEPVNVTATLFQQTAGGVLAQFAKNSGRLDYGYRVPDAQGNLSPASGKSEFDATLELPEAAKLPPIEFTKSSDRGTNDIVSVDDVIEYTLTAKNLAAAGSGLAITDPVMIDWLPVALSPEAFSDTEQYNIEAPEGLTLGTPGVTVIGGRSMLTIPMTGKLQPQATVTVKLKAKVTMQAVMITGDTPLLVNEAFLTTALSGAKWNGNPTGAPFVGPNSGAVDVNPMLDNELFGGDVHGYLTASTSVRLSANGAAKVFQRIRTDLNPNFADNGIDGVTQTSTSGGYINYELTLVNNSKQPIKNVRLMDLLPDENGDMRVSAASRFSQWTPEFVNIESVRLGAVDQMDTAQLDEVRGYTTYGASKAILTEQGIIEARRVLGSKDAPPSNAWHPEAAAGDRAIIVDIPDDVDIKSGEKLVVTLELKVPDEVDADKYAYTMARNSFSVNSRGGTDASRETSADVQTYLTPGRVSVGGNIWLDKNANGVQDVGEGFADIGVKPNDIKLTLQHFEGTAGKESIVAIPSGTGEFKFSELYSASPLKDTAEKDLYKANDGSLILGKLRSKIPSNYQLSVTPPSGYKVTTPFAPGGKKTISRNPADADEGDDAIDSNFYVSSAESRNATSERFYLWADTEKTDMTKDIGLVKVRGVEIHKQNESQQPIAGAVFDLYGPYGADETVTVLESGKLLQAGVTTDDQGVARFTGLNYYDQFIIVETAASEGYTTAGATATGLDPAEIAGAVAWTLPAGKDESAVLVVTNLPSTSSFSARKIAVGAGELADEQFTFELREGTDGKGKLLYTGKASSHDAQSVTVGADGTELRGTTIKWQQGAWSDRKDAVTGILGLQKGAYTVEELSGKNFTLTSINGSLPAGDGIHRFTVDTAQPAALYAEFTNTVNSAGAVTVQKKLDGGIFNKTDPVDGQQFSFTLTHKNGTVYTGTTVGATPITAWQADNGVVVANGALPYGEYTLRENAAAGYSFSGFTASDGAKVNEDGSLSFTLSGKKNAYDFTAMNKLRDDGQLTVTKQMKAGVSPAHDYDEFIFRLSRETNGAWQKVDEQKVKAGESHTFTGLTFGTQYQVEELLYDGSEYLLASVEKVTAGKVNGGSYTFTPTHEAAAGAVTFANDRKLGAIELYKYRLDYPDSPVAGVRFALYNYNGVKGEKLGEAATDGSGRLTFSGLTAGRYMIEETWAPSGYTVIKSQFVITLTIDGNSVKTSLASGETVAAINDGIVAIPNRYSNGGGGNNGGGGGNNGGGNNGGGGGNNGGGGGGGGILRPSGPNPLTNIFDEPIPLDKPILQQILDGEIPLGALPNTGGFPLGLLMPLGVMLAVAGAFMKRKSGGKNEA